MNQANLLESKESTISFKDKGSNLKSKLRAWVSWKVKELASWQLTELFWEIITVGKTILLKTLIFHIAWHLVIALSSLFSALITSKVLANLCNLVLYQATPSSKCGLWKEVVASSSNHGDFYSQKLEKHRKSNKLLVKTKIKINNHGPNSNKLRNRL